MAPGLPLVVAFTTHNHNPDITMNSDNLGVDVERGAKQVNLLTYILLIQSLQEHRTLVDL